MSASKKLQQNRRTLLSKNLGYDEVQKQNKDYPVKDCRQFPVLLMRCFISLCMNENLVSPAP